MIEKKFSPQSQALLDCLYRHHPLEEGANFDIMDFMHAYGKLTQALLYARLFVPEFGVVNGRVILDDGYKVQCYSKAVLESKTGDVDPDSFNFIEIGFVFGNSSDWDDDEDYILAELVAEAWRARLAMLFPDRKFIVEVIPENEIGDETSVGFREVTP
jgi:hypothetical protein